LKRFKFTLQTVHDFRERARETAERELAQASAELSVARTRLEKLFEQRSAAMDSYLFLFQSKEIDASAIAAHSDYINAFTRREREMRIHIAEIEQGVEARRKCLTEAMRDTETTAKLRDRQRELHDQDAARTEQKNLDEMAVVAVARRRASNT
jgi:flagellar export protein FliJ